MTAPRRPSEEQWDEHELVHIFTEILIQASRERSQSPAQPPPLPSQILFDSIRNANIDPSWPDLVLPNGRTLNACQNVFRQFATSGLQSAPPQIGFTTAEPSSRKRPYPSDIITPTGRVLKPKPATYPESSRLPMTTQASFPLSPLAEPTPPLGEPRKKRGRPTKKEQEERRKQTAFQQQGFTSQDRPQASQFHQTQVVPGPSSPPTVQPTAQTATTPKGPSHEESANSGSSGDKKRRGRPPRVAPTFESASQIPVTTTSTTTSHEPPPHTPSIHDRPGAIAIQSESTTQPPTSVVGESATPVAPSTEQPEDTRRSTRPRIWE